MNKITILITVGTTFISLAFSLLVWSGGRVEQGERLVFWLCAFFVFILGVVAWSFANAEARKEDGENKKERKEFRESFRNINNNSNELRQDTRTLIRELRKDRDERKHKPK